MSSVRPAIVLCLSLLFITNEAAADIVGRVSVIDGDTIDIRGERIRLHGIDAPESSQLCRSDSKPYRCGQQAALGLADFIGERNVRCEERGTDRYRRTIAVCFVGDQDIGAWLVREGWALAFRRYSLDYVGLEDEARDAGRGMWRGEFEAPWAWRATHPRGGAARN